MLMPLINLAGLDFTEDERKIVEGILSTKGASKGRLLSSKPEKRELYVHNNRQYYRNLKAKSAYVWRMVCFALIPYAPHSCLPMMVSLELTDVGTPHEETDKLTKELDLIVDKIVASQPTKPGYLRWARVL